MAQLMKIARPYAEAAFAYANEKNQLAQWSTQLSNLATIASDESMVSALGNPDFASENILDIFTAVMGNELTAEGKNLLAVMAENKRLVSLPLVSEAFEELKSAEENKVRATVFSARKTTVAQKNKLNAALNAKFNAEVEISYEEDKSLMGGIKIKVGDWVIDGSAQTQLNKLGAAIAQ